MAEIKRPDYFRYLVIKTTARGACEVLYCTDDEEAATHADIEAIRYYAEEIEAGDCRIDLYKIW